MTIRTMWISAILVGIGLLPMLFCARRMLHAEGRLDAARTAFVQTARDTQEIVDLRERDERVGLAERPAQDVIAQVNAVLAEIGVPSVGLKSLLPETDSTLNSGGGAGAGSGLEYRRQSLKLVLENLSVAEIGLFLAHWQKASSGKIWTPSRIELIHNRSGGGGGGGKSDANRYDLTVLLTAIYAAPTKEAP